MSPARPPVPDPRVRSEDARDTLARQTRILELIAAAAPLPDVLTEILTSLEHLMAGARCSVLLLDHEHGTLHHGAAPSLPEPYIASIDGMAIGEHAGSCGSAASLDAVVVAVDVRTDPRWADFRDAAVDAGLRSCWSTPIHGRDGLPIGTFAVYHDRPHRPSPREQLLVDRFTRLASVAIDHARLLGELVSSEARFRRIFDDNAMGIAVVGLGRTVITGNAALTALAGRGLTGSHLSDVLSLGDRSLGSRLDELDRTGTGEITFEALLHRADLPDVEVEVTVSPPDGRDGDRAQYIVNVLDLTERRASEHDRRARLEAETARRTAEEASHAKSQLLAAVGHEARTPIQAIVGFAELLGTMDLDETRRREALAHIDAAAGHVMDLLADVLDLSRIEAGALPLVLEPVRLRDVVDEVLGLVSATAHRRDVTLSHDLADDPADDADADDAAEDMVRVDRRRLRQVLLNLLSNAIRHGNMGGRVEVRIRSDRQDETVVLSVDDDGPGIPPEIMPRLFLPFARTQTSRSTPEPPDGGRESSGPGVRHDSVDPVDSVGLDDSVGLGLGLAHGLAAAMGGDLSVGSSAPTGTSMVLRLPRATARSPRR